VAQRRVAEQALSRAAGAPLVAGNRVRLLRDATENYPAWLEAIAAARRHIFFESYIFSNDEIGRMFVDALEQRARQGVKVFLLYDWLGTKWPRKLFAPLRAAGGEVRVFNPPRLDSPFGWVSRDHRKTIAIDGEIGFVSGLCISGRWLGNPKKGVEPWRDTGIEIRGPAVADLEDAFARIWATTGAPLPDEQLAHAHNAPAVGDVPVRVVATAPSMAGLFRLDQLIAALARERLWLTDAYFVGLTPYVQALCAAARDGVDVRLLVPGSSDIPIVSPLSRAGYRPLLESGVRVFEWGGSMLHAKSAVADARWARVGSTNLNVASFWANYELDVAVEDEGVAGEVADMYEQDLERATEIVLARRNRIRRAPQGQRRPPTWRPRSGSAGRAAAGAISLGSTVGAAIRDHRVLGPAEAKVLGFASIVLLALAAVGFLWPWLLAVPACVLMAWIGTTLLIQSLRLLASSGAERAAETAVKVKEVRPKRTGQTPVVEPEIVEQEVPPAKQAAQP
jgi:cardiolipin synthase A/B